MMRGARRSLGVVVFAVLLGMLGAVPAQAADWQSRQLDVHPGRLQSGFHGISCASESLCVAVGEADAVAVSTNPRGGAADWKIVRPFDVAVETDNKCILPPPNLLPVEAPCPVPPPYRQVRAVSCPTTSFCVAVTFDGYVYSSTDPTGPATSWRVADVDGSGRDTHLESVSCPDPGFCVAVSGNRETPGKVLSSSNPTGPGSAWQEVQLDSSLDLRGVSCTSRALCFAVASKGRILRSTNPGGGAGAWEEVGTPGGAGDLEAVDCLEGSPFLCLTGNSGGNLLTTTSPAASSWTETNGGASVQVTGVSCASASRCVAVDNNGNVMVSSDPTAARSWAITNLNPYSVPVGGQLPGNALFAASCPTTGFCALAGASGLIFTSTNPHAVAPSADGKPAPAKGRHRLIKRPRTTLVKVDGFREKTRFNRLKVGFRFHAKSKARGFVCKRDRGRYKRCRSPLRYWVPLGEHELRVRAIGPTGLRGPVATVYFRAYKNPNFD